MTQRKYVRKTPEGRLLPVSEVFYSIEGEGPLTGYPTVFIRSFGCNFTCQGFSNPSKGPIAITHIDSLDDFKPNKGCDSIYSWHPAYKHLVTKYDAQRLWHHILNMLPEEIDAFPAISITGGEPMLHHKFWAEFFSRDVAEQVVRKIIIETNGAVEPGKELLEALSELEKMGCLVVWANSPKLSNSGEPRIKAIRPEVLAVQQRVHQSLQYVKFVSDGSYESFDEIYATVNAYNEELPQKLRHEQVYVMPEGALKEQQEQIQRKVANMCLEYGFSFCARVHCWVYNNEVGT